MADLPHTGQGEWAQAQASPWITQNNLNRTFDGFCVKIVVLSRETVPPSDCPDGARYLIDTGATGDWAGDDGGIAIAKGEDAVNGWIVVPAASIQLEGNEIYIVDERVTLQRQAVGWVEGNYVFVDLDGAFDGATLLWDQSNGVFYFGDAGGGGSGSTYPTVTTDADDYTITAANVGTYARLTGPGSKQVIIQDEAIEALTANGEWHIRNAQGGDATIVPDVYVTVNLPTSGTLVIPVGATVSLKRVALNELDLIGLVEAA